MGQVLKPTVERPRVVRSRRLLAVRSDDYLVARVRAGDEAAFEVVYDRYAALLLAFCRHMLARADEAEEAVQHVFVSAHAGLVETSRAIALKPWLYTIARNRCLSMLRARRELPDADIEPATGDLHDEIQGRADLRELVSDLADLPEQQRAALLLTELDDLSHADAAAILDCEVGQVKGLVFRARAGLIERRDARAVPCETIREELATARRGTLRKGRLKHHLRECAGCAAYLEEVRHQRRMMALILPVIPSAGLKRSVLAAAGTGGGAAGAGGLTLAGSSALTAAVAKIAIAGVVIGGAGIAGHGALHNGRGDGQTTAPAAATEPSRPAAGPTVSATATPTRPPRRRVTPAPARSRGTQAAHDKTGSTARRGRHATAPGIGVPGPPNVAPGRLSRPASGLGNRNQGAKSAPTSSNGEANGKAGPPSSAKGGTRAHGAPAPVPQAGPKRPAK